MRLACEHPDLMSITDGLPHLSGAALAIAPISDYRSLLLDGEGAYIDSMAEKRQFEFSSGRHCAHRCQEVLDLKPAPILRLERTPVWPSASYRGSISHCDIAAVATITTEQKGIGVDIERTDRVKEKLFDALFTKSEKKHLSSLPEEAANVAPTVLFSAKESGYKAIFPIGGQFIGFHEATITVDWSRQTFTIEYLGHHAANRALNSGTGYWQIQGEYVLTIFVIS